MVVAIWYALIDFYIINKSVMIGTINNTGNVRRDD